MRSSVIVPAVLLLLCFDVANAEWVKVGNDVEWGAKDDKHGPWSTNEKICASRIKIVHITGYVSCRPTIANGASNFGCKGNNQLALHITDSLYECGSCSIIPAKDDQSIGGNRNGWWTKSGYSSASDELILDTPGKNYCFTPDKIYHLWYAEDKAGVSEHDNHGIAYVDIYLDQITTTSTKEKTTVTTTTATTVTVTTETMTTNTILSQLGRKFDSDLATELGKLEEQLELVKERLTIAEEAKEQCEGRLDKMEAGFTTLSENVKSLDTQLQTILSAFTSDGDSGNDSGAMQPRDKRCAEITDLDGFCNSLITNSDGVPEHDEWLHLQSCCGQVLLHDSACSVAPCDLQEELIKTQKDVTDILNRLSKAGGQS